MENRRSSLRRGFTLIELVVVIVIVAILAAVIVPRFFTKTEDAKVSAAKAEIATFKTQLGIYAAEAGSYPNTQQGLMALIAKPDGVRKWKGPYLQDVTSVPNDPWGNKYTYKSPGENGRDCDIVSSGPDSQVGTGDDIKSWDMKEQ